MDRGCGGDQNGYLQTCLWSRQSIRCEDAVLSPLNQEVAHSLHVLCVLKEVLFSMPPQKMPPPPKTSPAHVIKCQVILCLKTDVGSSNEDIGTIIVKMEDQMLNPTWKEVDPAFWEV